MKRLMYVMPLSAIAVLAFAAIAAAQPVVVPADTTTTPAESGTPTESTTLAPNSTTTVDISDNAFNPAQLNVASGTTVTFVNNGTVPHTATADNGAFDTGELQPGYSMDVYLEGSGTVTYHCELHPDMQGSIVVGEASQASDAGEGGGTEEGTNPPNQAVSVYP